MITEEQNKALLSIGNAALANPDWIEYANYCFDREKGLRDEAFKHLDIFLTSTEQWQNDQRIEFVKTMVPLFESIPEASYGPLPQPLMERLIKPTLEYWCEKENVNGRPFRWYGTYFRSEEHLFKAIEINSDDNIARQQLLLWWINDISFSVHELPFGYIGNPFEDLELGEKAKKQILQLTDPKLQEEWSGVLDEDLELVRNYFDWKKSGHSNFEQWGSENNKRVFYK